jgi:hypothetical protein
MLVGLLGSGCQTSSKLSFMLILPHVSYAIARKLVTVGSRAMFPGRMDDYTIESFLEKSLKKSWSRYFVMYGPAVCVAILASLLMAM